MLTGKMFDDTEENILTQINSVQDVIKDIFPCKSIHVKFLKGQYPYATYTSCFLTHNTVNKWLL